MFPMPALAANKDDEESDPLASSPDEAEDDPSDAPRDAMFGASIDDILEEHRRGGRKRKRRRYNPGGAPRARARQSELPADLQPLMTRGIMSYLQKDLAEAETLLRAIIEQAPRAVNPHAQLSLVLEERGDLAGALDHSVRAAELDRCDRTRWKACAARAQELGQRTRAIYCLTQALRGTQGKDAEALRARATLYMEDGKKRKAADSFVKLARVEPWDVFVARSISAIYVEAEMIPRAITALEGMVAEVEQLRPNAARSFDREAVISDLVELLVDLKLRGRQYVEANMMLSRLLARSAAVGRTVSFVQKVMLAICQHRLGSDTLAAPTFEEFTTSPTLMDKHRFLLWEVADALFDSGHYHAAADTYTLLLQLQDEHPRVKMFLRRATCYKEISFREGAKADLENVLALQPRHVEASLRLQEYMPVADINKKAKWRRFGGKSNGTRGYPRIIRKDREEVIGFNNEADTLFDNADYEGYLVRIYAALEAALELRRPLNCHALRRFNKNAIKSGTTGGANASASVVPAVEGTDNGGDAGDVDGDVDGDVGGDGDGEGTGSASSDSDGDRSEGDEEVRARKEKKRRELGNISMRSPLDKAKLQRLGATLMRLIEQEDFVRVAERVTTSFRALGVVGLGYPITRLFDSLAHLRVPANSEMRQRLKMLDLATSLAAGEVWRSFEHARQLLLEAPTDEDMMYVYTVLERIYGAQMVDSELRSTTYRYLARLRKKNVNSASLALITANCSSRGGLNVQRYTVGFYLNALELSPHNALICLCIAIQVLYVAMGRRIHNRNEVLPYAMGFLQDYQRHRLLKAGEHERGWMTMETHYNIGRALHQLGVVDAAANMYEKVLQHEVTGAEHEVTAVEELRSDAAYNLVQIYRASGSHELAAALCGETLMF